MRLQQIRRRSTKSGFTLVEILIVVIILGILAAIVIPQFTNASQDARKNSTSSLLQTIRSQVELYKLQHGDALPDLAGGTGWALLTSTSVYSGSTFGPYMQQTPRNPMNGLSTVVQGASGGTPSAAAGFLYDYGSGTGTGKIWAGGSTGATCYNEATGADAATIP